MSSWSTGSASPGLSPAPSPSILRSSWGFDVIHLPSSLEHTIRIKKGCSQLGIMLDMADKGVNGCIVQTLMRAGAVGKDGRIRPGDYITQINHESLRNVTNSQVKAILKRASLVGHEVNVTYIPCDKADKYKQETSHSQQQSRSASPMSISRLSPKSPSPERRNLTSAQSIDTDGETSVRDFHDYSASISTSGVASPAHHRPVPSDSTAISQ
uniref:PDZ domain-containing protein n=1 Tax=Romanomermis culicivorax TaxID=13658 RepID=A0A915IF22_ROMCU